MDLNEFFISAVLIFKIIGQLACFKNSLIILSRSKFFCFSASFQSWKSISLTGRGIKFSGFSRHLPFGSK
jgi:hypothetical protein